VSKLKKDLKRTKALLKDAQVMIERSKSDSSNKVVMRQLKNQVNSRSGFFILTEMQKYFRSKTHWLFDELHFFPTKGLFTRNMNSCHATNVRTFLIFVALLKVLFCGSRRGSVEVF
jgi:hypothetical protein